MVSAKLEGRKHRVGTAGSRGQAANLVCGPRRLHRGGDPSALLRSTCKSDAGWEAGDGGNFLSKQSNFMYDETEQRTSKLCLELQ